MHTSIYAGLCGLFLAWLALQTIKVRRVAKVKLGDNGNFELQSAIRAQGNFAEYMPITIVLLFLLEYNGAPALTIHFIGITFLAGRWIHAQGLLTDNLQKRALGMKLTLNILMLLAFANILLAIFKIFKAYI